MTQPPPAQCELQLALPAHSLSHSPDVHDVSQLAIPLQL
jgi:hypothetical protein